MNVAGRFVFPLPSIFILCIACSIFVGAKSSAASIHKAAKAGKTAQLRRILDADPKACRQTDERGITPLHNAAEAGHVEAVGLLLNAGADVDAASDLGFTSLHIAASGGHLEIAKLLISKGVKVSAHSKEGSEPLHFAVESQSEEMILLLLDHGADVNAVAENHPSKATPLATAVRLGEIDCIGLLIQHGANLNAKFFDMDASLLHYAAQTRQPKSMRALIKAGLDVDARDKAGQTPLITSANLGDVESAKVLISHGADVDTKTNSGYTPLMLASSTGQASMAKLLKESGAKE